MNNKIKLTVAIPTYNRIRYLKEALPELVKQCNEINLNYKQVEILINNNNSPDSTDNYIIQNFNKEEITYYKNTVNIGAQNNFLSCIERAKGEYVWLFGDDELILNNSIKKIIELIDKYDSELIIVGVKNYNKNLSETTTFRNLYDFYKYLSKNNLDYIIDHTLITFNIFKKFNFDLVNSRKYLDTDYAQMYGMINSFKKIKARDNFVCVSSDLLIEIRNIRPGFEYNLTGLLEKQKNYIEYIGHEFKIKSISNFSMNFYYKKLIRDKLKKFIKKIPFSRYIYNLFKYE